MLLFSGYAMSLFQFVQKTSNHFFPLINLNRDQCLNRFHKDNDCFICFDNCPTNAIEFVDNIPSDINLKQCNSCGLCLHQCPSEVFSQGERKKRPLFALLAHHKFEQIDLICHKHQKNYGHSSICINTANCLGNISLVDLIELGLQEDTQIVLNLSSCINSCGEHMKEQLNSLINQANNMLLEIQHSKQIHFTTNDDRLTKYKKIHAIDSIPVSRRSFFKQLKSIGKESIGCNIPDDFFADEPINQAIPISDHRKQLIHLLQKIEYKLKPDHVHDFIGLDIKKSVCDACGLCSKICPTKALVEKSQKFIFKLRFNPAYCLGDKCQLCSLACHLKAVNINPLQSLNNIETPIDLITLEQISCPRCLEPFFPINDEDDLCSACTASTKPKFLNS